MNSTDEFSFLLKPSNIPSAGVGVFAAHSILKGTRLYLHTDNHVSRELDGKTVPADLLKLCIAKENNRYLCPEHFNRIEVGWYVNHSSEPNIVKKQDGFHSIKDIKAGEELLMDYNQLSEPKDKKESFYKG